MIAPTNRTQMKFIYKIVLCLAASSLFTLGFSEGTKELNPTFGDFGILQIHDKGRSSFLYDTDETERLYFTVCDTSEVVHLGLTCNRNDVVFRVKDPNGDVFLSEQSIPTSGQEGYIDDWADAVAGPLEMLPAGSTAGYDAIAMKPSIIGDYFIEFKNTSNSDKRQFPLFDLTVMGADSTAISGRLWSKNWDVNCNGSANPFNGTMYVYSDDGITTQLSFNGIQPWGFTIFANQYGVEKSDPATLEDRYSVNNQNGLPQYKIFLNEPDEGCFPTGTYGDFDGDVIIEGCDPDNLEIVFSVTEPGFVTLMLNLNGQDGWQSGTEDIVVWNDSVSAGENRVPWNSLNGLGEFVVPGSSIPIQLDYSNGITHLPLYDVEGHINGYTVELIRPASVNGERPQLFWNDSKIWNNNPIDVLVEEAGCEDVNGCHAWERNDGDNKTINTYWYANILKEVAEYELDLAILVDANTFKVDDPSDPNANDTTFCATETKIQLGGAVTNASGGTWVVVSGDGDFDDNTDLGTFYNVEAQDVVDGEVVIALVADSSQSCSGNADTMTIRFQAAPVITIDDLPKVCANNPTLNLSGSATNSGGAFWTGSGGTFTPDSLATNPSYTPSQDEIDEGSTWVYYTSYDNGLCASSSDSAEIEIGPSPVAVTIETLDSLCENNADSFELNGEVSFATGGTWSGGTGNYVSGANSLITQYEPTQAELNAGEITFSLTTTGHDATCIAESIDHTITFSDAPTVEAGDVILTCENNVLVELNGSVTGGDGGTWSGEGTFDDDDTILSGLSYTPSQNELDALEFYVVLASNDYSTCLTVYDSVKVTVENEPSVSIAGDDQVTACALDPVVSLNVAVANAASVQWTGQGGDFLPSATSSNPDYELSQAEIDAGISTVTVTTTNANGCTDVIDEVTILVNPAPVVEVPDTLWGCANNMVVDLEASVDYNFVTNHFWQGGTDVFGDRFSLATTYTTSEAEAIAGSATVTFTAISGSDCSLSEDVLILFDKIPEVDAGDDIISCANNSLESLNPSVVYYEEGVSKNGTGDWSNFSGVLTLGTPDTYEPNSTEVETGFVDLILTYESDQDLCSAVSDTVRVTYGDAPTIESNGPLTVCENNGEIELNVVSSTGAGRLVDYDGAITSGVTDLDGTYFPSVDELALDSFKIVFRTRQPGVCSNVFDTLTIFVEQAPEITLGTISDVCGDNPDISLSATVLRAGSGIWTGGFGEFSIDSSLATVYSPTPQEIQDNEVSITVTSIDNGLCNPVSETITVGILDLPTVDAGSDQTLCGDVSTIQFNASFGNAGGGVWSHNGQGGFNTSDSIVNPVYQVNSNDLDDTLVFIYSTIDDRGCDSYVDTVFVNFTDVPSVEAGDAMTVCTNDLPIQLTASGSASRWSGGNGTFTPDNETLNAIYSPTDNEINNGALTLTLTSIAAGSCDEVSDNVTITILEGPEVFAGGNQTVCRDTVELLTATLNNSNQGVWTSSGRGFFIADSLFSNATAYVLDSKDREDSTLSIVLTSEDDGICSQISDTATITIIEKPLVSAGPDQTFCGDVGAMTTFGTAQNVNSLQWTSLGDGDFDPIAADSLLSDYSFGNADITNGFVDLILASTDNGVCDASIDSVRITLTDIPTVTASAVDAVCADVDTIDLVGAKTVALGVKWSALNGTGTFYPSAFDSSTSYITAPEDALEDSLVFVLEGTDVGLCNAVFDTIIVDVTPAPVIDLGGDEITVCEDSLVNLNAVLTVATAGYWSTTGSGVIGDTNLTNTSYISTEGDYSLGAIDFTFTSTEQGSCKTTTETITANFVEAPTVDAGGAITICETEDSVKIIGSVEGEGSFIWTILDDGFIIGDADTAVVFYTPGNNEIANEAASLVLASVSDGFCAAVSDTTEIEIQLSPTVEAGNDVTICADSSYLEVGALTTNAVGVQWNSLSGAEGNFSANVHSDTIIYVLSDDELQLDSFNLVVETEVAGTCSPDFDTVTVFINGTPEVSIDQNDFTVCSDLDSISLTGTVEGATGGVWTTSNGSGAFSEDSLLSTAYLPGVNDYLIGTIFMKFTSYGNGLCASSYTDQIEVSIDKLAELSYFDTEVCSTEEEIQIEGEVDHKGGVEWTVLKGALLPNVNDDTPIYRPTSSVVSSGSIELYVESIENGVCQAVVDTVTIEFYQEPTIGVSDDITICEDGSANLEGTATNVADFKWSTSGSGNFFPNALSEDVEYVPSDQDKLDSTLVLKFESLSNGPCPLIADSVLVYINPLPEIDVFDLSSFCSSSESFEVEAVFSNAAGISWTTADGAGHFIDSTDVNTFYDVDDEDRSQTEITVIATTVGNNACDAVSDKEKITLTKAPSLDAGPDKLLCSDTDVINIDGAATNVGTISWESESGLGSFNSISEAVAEFTLDAIDLAKDSLKIKIIGTDNGACDNLEDVMTLYIVDQFEIDAGDSLQKICDTDLPAQLNGTGASGTWSGGLGDYSPSNNALNAIYTPHADELAAGFVTLTLTSVSNATCSEVEDTVRLEFLDGPVVSFDTTGIEVCSDTAYIELSTTLSNASGVLWSSNSGGVFFDNDTDQSVRYSLTEKDIDAEFVDISLVTTGNGECEAISLTKTIDVRLAPELEASPDQVLCADVDTVNVSGSFKNTGGFTWRPSGNGTIIGGDDRAIEIDYLISSDDSSSMIMDFVMESDDDGLCKVVYDTVTITLSPAVTLDAGDQIDVCETESAIALSPDVAVASGVSWSAIGGFNPGATSSNAQYVPNEAALAKGSVMLYATTIGNGDCNAVMDSVEIVFEREAFASIADTLIQICHQYNTIDLNGSVTTTGTGIWSSTGTGDFDPDDVTLTASYSPSLSDMNQDMISIFLTSSGSTMCAPSFDLLQVEILESPATNIHAGFDFEVCADTGAIQLDGEISGAVKGAIWSTSGSGEFSPNVFDLNATYVLSSEDSTSGGIEIYLTSEEDPNGVCDAYTDTMSLSIVERPTIDLGLDYDQCEDNPIIELNPSYTNAGGIRWDVSGDGVFVPSSAADTVTYTIAPEDLETGVVGFTATTTHNGSCKTYSDDVLIRFTDAPTIAVFEDVIVCDNIGDVSIEALFSVATGVVWTSGTNGVFDDSLATKAEYTLSEEDIANQRVIVTGTTTGNGDCQAVSAEVVIDIEASPSFVFINEGLICQDYDEVSLRSTVQNADSIQWSVVGTGEFEDGDYTSLEVNYILSEEDKLQDSLLVIISSVLDEYCLVEKDTTVISIERAPVVDVSSAAICTNFDEIGVSASIENAGGVFWSSANGGVFEDIQDTSTFYYPSQADMNLGATWVYGTSTQNGTCTEVVDSVEIIVRERPLVDAGKDFITCFGDQQYITGSNDRTSSYQWTNLTGDILSEGNVMSYLATQDSTFVLSIIDQFLCENSDSVDVITLTPPTFNLPGQICYEQGFALDADPQNEPTIVSGLYQWYHEGQIQIGESDPRLFLIEDEGVHKIQYSYEACLSEASITVSPLPILEGQDKIVCIGSVTEVITSEIEGASYSWSDSLAVNYTESTAVLETVINDTSTFYVVVTDTLNCESTDTIRIIAVEEPVFELSDTTLCDGISVLLDGQPSNLEDTTFSSYEWVSDEVSISSESQVEVNSSGTYTLTYSIGECVRTLSSEVAINPLPVINNEDEVSGCISNGEMIILDAGPGESYVWLADSSAEQTLEVTIEDFYFVHIFNEYGCYVRDSIYAYDECPPELYVPTLITLGSGDQNAEWKVEGTDFVDFNVTLFNRWGEVIFFSEDPYFRWDGTYKGQAVQTGVYAYIIRYRGTVEGHTDETVIEGSLTIIE